MRPPKYSDFKNKRFVCISFARALYEKLAFNFSNNIFQYPVLRSGLVIGFAITEWCNYEGYDDFIIEVQPTDTIWGKEIGEESNE